MKLSKLPLVLVLLSFCFTTYAHFVRHEPFKITQPDGVVRNCFITGDEFYRRVYDENGFTITINHETGYYVYATLIDDELVPTNYVVGEVDPAEVGLIPDLDISTEKKYELRERWNEPLRPVLSQTVPGLSNAAPGSRTGTMNNIVIYISFPSPNDTFSHTKSQIESLFIDTARGASLYSYFRDISGGKFNFNSSFFPQTTGTTILSYQAPNSRSYYANTSESQRAAVEHLLLRNAINYCKTQIEAKFTASQLDSNGDGYVDNVIFVVQGSEGAWASFLWPHKWGLSSYNVTLNGKKVWDYNFIMENHLFTAYNGKQSALVHEAYHTLGAPDLYRYDNKDIDPVGSWDIMSTNLIPPQSSGSYLTYRYGKFIGEIPEIRTSGTYAIYDIWNRTPGQNICYKLLSPKSTSEYYVLDYRKSSGEIYESGLLSNGIVIERIRPALYPNGNQSGPPDEVYVFRADASNNQTQGSLNPVSKVFFSQQNGRISFNSTSNPPCFLTDNTKDAISISNISASGGDSMTFYVNIGITPDFTASSTNILRGKTIQFTNSSSNVTNVSMTYQWTFEGGIPASSTLSTPSAITYNTSGTYAVTLRATTSWGYMVETKTQYIKVCDTAITRYSEAICSGGFYTDFHFADLTEAGIYYDTLQNINGCDSIIMLNLTVNHPVINPIEGTICLGETYTLNGFNESTEGIYTQTLTASNNCDSIVTLKLTVNHPVINPIEGTICLGETYTLNGFNESTEGVYTQTLTASNNCDSIVSLTLSVYPVVAVTNYFDAICSGGSYTDSHFANLTEAGVYYDTLQNINGCDSVVCLTLTEINTPNPSDIIITPFDDNFVISWQGDAPSYQLFRNSNLLAIVSITTYTDNDLIDGVNYCYQIKAIDGDCESNFSAEHCQTFNDVSIMEYQATNLRIYPNPTTGQLHVTVEDGFKTRLYDESADYTIYSVTGQLIMRGELQGETAIIDITYLPTGIYYLQVAGEMVKVVKE